MTYLLDTNTVIARLNGDSQVGKRLQALRPEDVLLSTPVLAELIFGAELSGRRDENLARVERLAAGAIVVGFDAGAARHFGRIKAELRRKGVPKSDFDLAIAAIALEHDAVLVTSDRALHDGNIAGLRVESWAVATP